MSKDVNKRKSIRRAKIVTEVCISAVILGIGGYAIASAVKKAEPVGVSTYTESSIDEIIITEPVTEPVDPDKVIFETLSVNTKEKFRGSLILVNHDHQYFTGDENLVVINEKLDEDGRTSYTGNDYNMKIRDTVYEPLSMMMDDFNKATGYDDIVIIGGYRTTERQQELYDEDLAATGNDTSERVALPGHSEHESGYALDFTTSTTWDYDGTGEYDWIDQNCWKYGFILRYGDDKTEITKIQYEPWHYRYVGVPHAYYMYKNNLCLEEYIDLVKNYPYEGEHLKFTDGNNVSYEIYFVKSDDGAETTFVPVPNALKYEISGNNTDGFIVTVYSDEKAESSTQNQQAATAAGEENTTEEASTEPEEAVSEDVTEESTEDSTDESASDDEGENVEDTSSSGE